MIKNFDSAQCEYDIAIIGGGLVGASLAVALEASGLSSVVIEPVAVDDSLHEQPSFDERTVALTYHARQIYTGMGIWEQIAPHAQPILEIHLSDRGHFGMTHLRHTDAGVDALGYVVPTRVLGQVLHQRIKQSDTISLLCPGTVTNVRDTTLEVSHEQATMTVKSRLVVIADGGRAQLGQQIGIRSIQTSYPQNAILSIVKTDREHHGRAYERFTSQGPLALLPHSDNRYAVVWTTKQKHTEARMALSDSAFIAELQQVFGMRAGNFSDPTARKSYALQHSQTTSPIAKHTVMIGNAAHSVHPVAGQGFNLGLRDVAVLAEIIHDAEKQQQDIASAMLLEKYVALRKRETERVSGFTDGLIRLFCSSRKSITLVRNTALVGIELFPPAKRFLLRHTLGLAAKPSRLGVGLPLG